MFRVLLLLPLVSGAFIVPPSSLHATLRTTLTLDQRRPPRSIANPWILASRSRPAGTVALARRATAARTPTALSRGVARARGGRAATAPARAGAGDDGDGVGARSAASPSPSPLKVDASVLVVLLAAFLNLLGFTMAGPITPALGAHFGLGTGPRVGALTSAYPLGMLLGVFIWPRLSDRIGRRRVLSHPLPAPHPSPPARARACNQSSIPNRRERGGARGVARRRRRRARHDHLSRPRTAS